ncbi:MmyB family transcriptional regulator [Streptomyces sp. CMB-StM0423]|uniref:MmyB family transcriptional regulator n=1 Tax=Streptomyces sp. CMB-StM0423 TaxID=2059884 RepID=UPI00131D495B|nr:helix-turn-helix domain-containing protein [Streptomyces sp. CMB-StM0423]
MQDHSLRVSQPELGELLKSWRRRAHRRRGLARRLTQQEMAESAGIGRRKYQDLEAGRSRPLLAPGQAERLTAVLGLSDDERTTLFLLATQGMPRSSGTPQATPLSDSQLLMASFEPTPAVVLDSVWNVRAYNAAMASWFPFVTHPRANILLWCVSHPDARTQIADWSQHTRSWLGILRQAQAMHGSSPDVEAIVEHVIADPALSAMWTDRADTQQDIGGERFTLQLPVHDGKRIDIAIQVLYPSDGRHHQVGILTPISATCRPH